MKKFIEKLSVKTILLFIIAVLFWIGANQFIGTRYNVSWGVAAICATLFGALTGASLRNDWDNKK